MIVVSILCSTENLLLVIKNVYIYNLKKEIKKLLNK